MQKILLFGAGKSATVLIKYFLDDAKKESWFITVVDADLLLAQKKINNSIHGKALSFDINDNETRKKHIAEADIVLSLLPPHLHILVAEDCIVHRKNLLTASYVDDTMRTYTKAIEANDLLFLCEMGLDPGIDHMSAKKIIDDIQHEGGKIISFLSHCGGLVAPESDDNPWHYKISWNPRNIVLAGKTGAIFKKDNNIEHLSYDGIFEQKRFVNMPGQEFLCWYPNRDSLSYAKMYGLEDCPTFIRTTLRHSDFMYGWKNVIDLKLTAEDLFYDTDEKTLKDVFKEHMDKNGFSEWLQNKLHEQFDYTKTILAELVNLTEMEEKASEKGVEQIEEFMMVNEEGDLQEVDIEDLKLNAASMLAEKMHDAKLTLKQLFFLGMDDGETKINKGRCSAADVLQFALERKLSLNKDDKDMIVMLHEIEYEVEDEKYLHQSSLIVKGENGTNTAMAKTVGLPLGIAAKLILNGTIQLKGLHIPIHREIYDPVLAELEKYDISFSEAGKKL